MREKITGGRRKGQYVAPSEVNADDVQAIVRLRVRADEAEECLRRAANME